MLDNLRNQGSTPFFQDEEENEIKPKPDSKQKFRDFQNSRIFKMTIPGLTPLQQFILVLLLFMVIGLLGTMFLLVTGKVMPPFI